MYTYGSVLSCLSEQKPMQDSLEQFEINNAVCFVKCNKPENSTSSKIDKLKRYFLLNKKHPPGNKTGFGVLIK